MPAFRDRLEAYPPYARLRPPTFKGTYHLTLFRDRGAALNFR